MLFLCCFIFVIARVAAAVKTLRDHRQFSPVKYNYFWFNFLSIFYFSACSYLPNAAAAAAPSPSSLNVKQFYRYRFGVGAVTVAAVMLSSMLLPHKFVVVALEKTQHLSNIVKLQQQLILSSSAAGSMAMPASGQWRSKKIEKEKPGCTLCTGISVGILEMKTTF